MKKFTKNHLREFIVKELLSLDEKKINPKKDPEHIFKHVIRVGSKLYYGLGAVYQVTKLYPGGFSVQMRSAGKSGGMFAKKFNMEYPNFISQSKMGLIKWVEG